MEFYAAFAIQNASPVAVKFLVWEFESSLKELFDKKRKINELERQLKEWQQKLNSSEASS